MIVKPDNPQKLIAILKEKFVVLYGAGGAGISIAKWCDENKINFIFADQAAKQKQTILGRQIVLPETLATVYSNANIVVSSIIYYDEIVEKLLGMGIQKSNILSYQLFLPSQITWTDLEHNTIWGVNTERVRRISEWITADTKTVADYGEGKLSLKMFLDPSIQYYPFDYIRRSDQTILCNFDRDELPTIKTDISVCTATLVFIMQAERLLKHLCDHTSNKIIISYVTLEKFKSITGRRASGYVNDFTERDIQGLLLNKGFYLAETQQDPANKIDTLFLFYKK